MRSIPFFLHYIRIRVVEGDDALHPLIPTFAVKETAVFRTTQGD